MPLGLQALLDGEVVLDDPVVHDDDPAMTIAMRMRVLFRRPAVRGPPRVADAVESFDRIDSDRLFEIRKLAGRPAQRNPLGADDRHSRGVVAAIFHAPQPLDEHGHNRLRTDVSNDSAHKSVPGSRLFPFDRRLLPLNPSVDVRLSSSSNSKRAVRHVLGNR